MFGGCPSRPSALVLRRVRSGNKKERGRRGPLSIRDRMRTISCGGYHRFRLVRQGPRGRYEAGTRDFAALFTAFSREENASKQRIRPFANLTLPSPAPPRLPVAGKAPGAAGVE